MINIADLSIRLTLTLSLPEEHVCTWFELWNAMLVQYWHAFCLITIIWHSFTLCPIFLQLSSEERPLIVKKRFRKIRLQNKITLFECKKDAKSNIWTLDKVLARIIPNGIVYQHFHKTFVNISPQNSPTKALIKQAQLMIFEQCPQKGLKVM